MNNLLAETQKFEVLIQGLIDQKFGFIDQFLDESIISGLRFNLINYYENNQMNPAGIGKKFDYQKNTEVRGDLIKWINNNTTDFFEKAFLDQVQNFINHLNSTCYTSINDFEFHYAIYDVGSFYKRHLDQFKTDRGRKFSLVTYLNDDWKKSDGGNLSLYLEDEKIENVFPYGGRSIFFKSDELEHEVHPSHNRKRFSIAGWLKTT
ncbi:2OG-Fe(II) oxygenase [Namhaeicola litoreus]|uniref:2OG-Fe(II) oxygenase n=1 Tax=Namhaeicola litoreus TaxID=1052145 RepID=A0ABW3Y6R0_9FLAO